MAKKKASKNTNRTPKKGAVRKTTAPDWAPRFLSALAATANVSASCLAAGIARNTVYLRRDADEGFAKRMADALEDAVDDLELEARRRARDGLRRVKFHQGDPILVPLFREDGLPALDERGAAVLVPYVEHEYSDTLMIFLLKAHRPEKYRENVKVEVTGKVISTIEISHDDGPEVPAGD